MPDDTSPVDKTIIRPIQLDDAQGRWVFEPREDITALEAVLINHMFAAIAIRHLHGNNSRWDWREYLTRDRSITLVATDGSAPPTTVSCNLARHFSVTE